MRATQADGAGLGLGFRATGNGKTVKQGTTIHRTTTFLHTVIGTHCRLPGPPRGPLPDSPGRPGGYLHSAILKAGAYTRPLLSST